MGSYLGSYWSSENTEEEYDKETLESKSNSNLTSDSYKRCIIYYSPGGPGHPNPISLDDISTNPDIDIVEMSTFHLGTNSDGSLYVHLNNWDCLTIKPEYKTYFEDIKNDITTLQSAGKTVILMLGGGSDLSYQELFDNFDGYYPLLSEALKNYNFDGIDLDIEDGSGTNDNVSNLLTNLISDFGDQFKIAFSPVPSAITNPGPNISGNLNYLTLYQKYDSNISWLSLQCYSGELDNVDTYETCVSNGFSANQLVTTMLYTTDATSTVQSTIKTLSSYYNSDSTGYFGGVNVWAGNSTDITKWSQTMTSCMNSDFEIV